MSAPQKNWLELSDAEREAAALAERQRGDRPEVCCPACTAWRPAFTVVLLDAAEAADRGVAFACDADRSRWAREDEA